MENELSVTQQQELDRYEKAVVAGFQSGWDALYEIKERKLWAGHKSFAAYCKDRFGWPCSSVYEKLEARRQRERLQDSGIPEFSTQMNESHARIIKEIETEYLPVCH